jgi:hypothetical protein
MPDHTPLTKEERDKAQFELDHGITALRSTYFTFVLRRYEATVRKRDERIAALEAENARLTPLAHTGEAAEGMPVGFGLSHAAEKLWLIWDSRGGDDLDETCGESALAALEALAALRAAEGEDDA